MRAPTAEFSVLVRDVAMALRGYRAAVDRLMQLFDWDASQWKATKIEASRVVVGLLREAPDVPAN